MDDHTPAEISQLLRARRAAVAAALRTRSAGARELLDARGADSSDDEHDPEGSTLSGEWSMIEGVRQAERRELADIDAALSRVDADTFGVCESCAGRIPIARLRARPMATTCVACAQR